MAAASDSSSFGSLNTVSDEESTGIAKPSGEEPEGKRMKQFRMVMQKCIDKFLASGGRREKFKSCFAAIQKKEPEIFESITQQLMQQLKKNIGTEIALMIKQEGLVYLFNELDQIVEQSDAREPPAWRPSRDPAADSLDHTMPMQIAYRDQLQSMLQEVEHENERLKAVVLPRRQELRESEMNLSSRAQDLMQAAEFCEKVDLKNLEVWVDNHR